MKNKIAKSIIIIKAANKLKGIYGQYRVKIGKTYFETDLSGKLYKSDSGTYYTQWIDTGVTVENKIQFVNAVMKELNN